MTDITDKKVVVGTNSQVPDFEKGTIDIPAADSALTFLRNEGGELVDIDEKRLVRKIDFMIIP